MRDIGTSILIGAESVGANWCGFASDVLFVMFYLGLCFLLFVVMVPNDGVYAFEDNSNGQGGNWCTLCRGLTGDCSFHVAATELRPREPRAGLEYDAVGQAVST